MIFVVVASSIKSLLNPELTASWEKGLTYVADGTVTSQEYMETLNKFIATRTNAVMQLNNQYQLREAFLQAAPYYKEPAKKSPSKKYTAKAKQPAKK